jgi:hypothetical protein
MPKPKAIQLNINHPCTQNWDEMTSVEQGRFCAHCKKNVIDFTTWSDNALYNFFSKETHSICGRLSPTQVNRPVAIPYQPHSALYRMSIALGLTLLFYPTKHSSPQNRVSPIVQTDSLHKNAGNYTSKLAGRILNHKKSAFAGAIIIAYSNDSLAATTYSDNKGFYKFENLSPGDYKISVSLPGYDTATVSSVTIRNKSLTSLNFRISKRTDCTPDFSKAISGNITPGYIENRFFTEDKIKELKRKNP